MGEFALVTLPTIPYCKESAWGILLASKRDNLPHHVVLLFSIDIYDV